MGVRLSGAGGALRLQWTTWIHLCELAREYGWEPAGTEPPDPAPEADWTGGYFTSEQQSVTAADAADLADALEGALGDIPDEDTLEFKTVELAHGVRSVSAGASITPQDGLSGKRKETVRAFIAFARQGSFSIGS